MKKYYDFINRLFLSVNRARIRNEPDELNFISLYFESENKIIISYQLEENFTDESLESCRIITTEIISDFSMEIFYEVFNLDYDDRNLIFKVGKLKL